MGKVVDLFDVKQVLSCLFRSGLVRAVVGEVPVAAGWVEFWENFALFFID